MKGFTYNGIHSSKYNCYHTPNADDRWRESPAFEVYNEEVPGRDGGYCYGYRTKIRTINLKVFYEDITIETREKIRAWLDRKTSGYLVFDERPFVKYYVRPAKTVPGKSYTTRHEGVSQDVYSGTFTIDFTAYEPFGTLNYKYYTDYDEEGAGLYCGILEKNDMPAKPTTASRSFLVYNCGTETCNTVQRIAGTAKNGIEITNKTNGSRCKLSSLPVAGYIEIDSEVGSVTVVNGNERTLDFQYHNEGYLTLAPYGQKYDNVMATTTAGSKTVQVSNCDNTEDLIGKHMLVRGAWLKIVSVVGNTITLESSASKSETIQVKISGMNEIEITGDDISLTKLELDYSPLIV